MKSRYKCGSEVVLEKEILVQDPDGCGTFKEHNIDVIELKRIFVKKENRQQGLSKLIMSELEKLGISKGYKYALLETGIKQHEVINLYKNTGNEIIENYEPYI